ncbi:hypothetical protein [Flavobacterium crassostreae]|uniref:hypothetical protein n=1 Tax=Flavobacterium crassostreae TaxID=1763534 RepID=UPI000B1E698A|nr:hypothetical protein [Flavobacterium crassostreae]
MLSDKSLSCCQSEITECSSADFKLKNSTILTNFDNREYGFVNKRLPVVKFRI